MSPLDKLGYGLYWFRVCWEEWYDTVMLGYYDEEEHPAWDFFNHINCNYPLTYGMITGKND
jgi:hypothetical protein